MTLKGQTRDPNTLRRNISKRLDLETPFQRTIVNLLSGQYVTEWAVFKAIDTFHATATELDDVPAWFLRLGAVVLAKPSTAY